MNNDAHLIWEKYIVNENSKPIKLKPYEKKGLFPGWEVIGAGDDLVDIFNTIPYKEQKLVAGSVGSGTNAIYQIGDRYLWLFENDDMGEGDYEVKPTQSSSQSPKLKNPTKEKNIKNTQFKRGDIVEYDQEKWIVVGQTNEGVHLVEISENGILVPLSGICNISLTND